MREVTTSESRAVSVQSLLSQKKTSLIMILKIGRPF
nr:MAG TPA: hypothetical protein [Caudoviricetes sp.]